ncbi:Hypothetical protein HVIM_03961 (plasmid) [Roseomonas mucosa]|nr:Hypothetical protein HVIM_03961 [Roseomonas mucosa]
MVAHFRLLFLIGTVAVGVPALANAEEGGPNPGYTPLNTSQAHVPTTRGPTRPLDTSNSATDSANPFTYQSRLAVTLPSRGVPLDSSNSVADSGSLNRPAPSMPTSTAMAGSFPAYVR